MTYELGRKLRLHASAAPGLGCVNISLCYIELHGHREVIRQLDQVRKTRNLNSVQKLELQSEKQWRLRAIEALYARVNNAYVAIHHDRVRRARESKQPTSPQTSV